MEHDLSPPLRKRQRLYTVLTGIFLTNAIIAEVVGVKIFSVEALLGVRPAHLNLIGDFVLDFDLTAGVVLWPIVFVTSDIINEYFGPSGVRRISVLTAIFIAYGFLAIYVATVLPPAQFWLRVNQPAGGDLNYINAAYAKIFQQGLRIILGSLVAFLVSQLLDVYVFHALRRLTGSKKIWLRATGSTLVSQLVDSFVVLFIAFYQPWSAEQVLAVGLNNYLYKFAVAVALTPLLYLAHSLINAYLGKQQAEELATSAAQAR